MTDPERWLSSGDAPLGMRELLQEAQRTGPSAAQRAALSAKLGVATSGLWISPLVKALTIGAAVAGGGLLYSALKPPAVHPVPVVVDSRAVETVADAPALLYEAPAAEEAAPAATAPTAEVEGNTAETATSSQKVHTPTTAKQPSEAQLLSQAKATLSSAPAKSLNLLARHEKLYPHGVLAQEREVLKVKALQNAGRIEAAEREAREFRKSHPDSIHHLPTDER